MKSQAKEQLTICIEVKYLAKVISLRIGYFYRHQSLQ